LSNFRLSKWYLDCVSEEGTAFIGYAADLHWRGVSLHYASILTRSPDGNVRTETTLRNLPLPVFHHHVTRWRVTPFAMDAEWVGLQDPVERLLLEGDGQIQWSCCSPMAMATVNIDGVPLLHGLGYVEFLELTVAKIPIRELRWGRFLTGTESVVWIDWKGPLRKTVVLRNGQEIANATVQDLAVEAGAALRLSLERSATIRSGPVSSTLSQARGLTQLFPRSILRMDESKWLSRGTLHGSPDARGWAIHELVRFS
jgi:hypothetical protein